MLSIRRFTMTRQILFGVVVISVLVAVALGALFSYYSRLLAVRESEDTLKKESAMVVNIIEYAQLNMQNEALYAARRFRDELLAGGGSARHRQDCQREGRQPAGSLYRRNSHHRQSSLS
ncbi:MAG: hypothetical protein LBS70_05905 [Candidatus Accumulibacter sp.]|jgi:ABC-type siderophore export system fused ATPase/permease subunit|nr:hypothetical protein [Accumulibacter sp.]